jgi:hypothetical protein
MSIIQILTIASALLIGASSLAMAQQPQMVRRHAPVNVRHSTVRTGTAMNRHKIRRGYYPRMR